jgi:predicted nucleic acid-binding protein
MNKIYLDYNIIVRLMNKNEPRLEEIIFSIDRTKFQLVYSPAHIEEMAVSTKRNNYPFEKTKEKLAFLSALTNNTEILPFRRNDVRVIEDLGMV